MTPTLTEQTLDSLADLDALGDREVLPGLVLVVLAEGIGTDYDTIKKLITGNPEALAMWTEATKRPVGGDRQSEEARKTSILSNMQDALPAPPTFCLIYNADSAASAIRATPARTTAAATRRARRRRG